VDLETVADELYGLQPAEFTSARDARAAEARKSGDRELAAEIKALRRPTASAWLANLLARSRSDQVTELLDLGEALRQAQANLSGDELRTLSSQRHQVVSALAQEARRVAYEQGERVSDAVQQELEGTLEAALADPRAGEALQAGRLTSALSYSGLGEVDLSSVVSLGPARKQTAKKSTKQAAGKKRALQDQDAELRKRAEEKLAAASQRLTEAKQAESAARGQADDAGRTVDELTAEEEQVHARIRELESALEEVQERATRLASAVREAKRNRTAADRAVSSAAHRVEQAEAAAQAAEQERKNLA
jgi:hypothetical protein